MANFKVGDKLICVKAPIPKGNEIVPVKHKEYTLRGVNNNHGGLWLEEIINIPKYYSDGFVEASFHPDRFRKLDTQFTEETIEMLESWNKEENRVLELEHDPNFELSITDYQIKKTNIKNYGK